MQYFFTKKRKNLLFLCVKMYSIEKQKLREEYMKYRYNHGSVFKATLENTLADIEANFKL